jgi:hypothetical protein
VANALQERFAEVLLDKIRSENYPSVTQMDMLESVASERVLVEYVLHLLERIQQEPHPSIPMMQRAVRLMAQFGS